MKKSTIITNVYIYSTKLTKRIIHGVMKSVNKLQKVKLISINKVYIIIKKSERFE